jgi:PKD repeat protein
MKAPLVYKSLPLTVLPCFRLQFRRILIYLRNSSPTKTTLMLRTLLRVCLGMVCGFYTIQLNAQLNPYCAPPWSQIDLDINNVRARIMVGGDMWWDLTTARYEIPKNSGNNSLFCGSVWMGGLDPIGNLHVAAGTYRQTGIDFWAGPLDTIYHFPNDSSCDKYDRIWRVNRATVESFVQNRTDPAYVIPEEILSWPGNGNTAWGHAKQLAPYVDVDANGIYNPLQGDYPAFNLSGQNNCNQDLLGDQALWWVFNDNGNTHSETGGQPFGLEVHATAYAFSSQEDALNNATFYRYKIINRSTVDYHSVWFGMFSDYDLGDAFDDYVGCDVGRGLGYCYNGDTADGSSPTGGGGTYGEHPPSIGVDFLNGPLADPDGVDNDRDFFVDETNERFILSGSIYYDGNFTVTGNPSSAPEFYTFLQSKWKDGTHLTYGGSGYGNSVIADFMFPGTSDPLGWGTGGVPQPPWDEINSGNLPSDRRQLNSVGPFTFQSGEVDYVHVGIPWARDTNGNNFDAIVALQAADDVIQSLFDNCFTLPCASQALPEITYTYENQLAFFTLLGGGTSWLWDFGDGQTSTAQHPSHYFTIPGTYTITVAVTSPCGTNNDTTTLVVPDYTLPCGPAITRIEGQGNGNQEMHFTKETIEEILSSPEHRSLFPVYAPGHGPVIISYEDYHHLQDGDYRIAFDSIDFTSNWKMWMVGGTDTVYSDSTIGSGNVQRIAMWGLGVQMQQVKNPGYNNNPDRNGFLTASISFGDPDKNWLTGVTDYEGSTSENWIRAGWRTGTGACVAEFNDRFNGINPIDRNEDYESILGGTWAPYRICAYSGFPSAWNVCYDKGPAWYPNPPSAQIANKFENISNVDIVITSDKTKWTRCCVLEVGDTALNQGARDPWHLRDHPSVDKEGRTVSTGGISDSNNPAAADYIGANGMGWFPGYAINLETGERLNMAFAENSAYTQENGRDMMWNPTENEYAPLVGNLWGGCHYIYVFGHNGDATFTSPGPLAGELKDMPRYDYGKAMYTILAADNTANTELREVYADAMWTTIPVINPGHSFMESDVTVKLRVQKPYAAYQTDSVPQNNNYPLYGFHIDKYNLECNAYMGDVTVFPNPFADQSVIHFENTDEHEAKVKLYDVQGKLVREINTTSDRVVISSAGLFSGMYIWTLELDGEKPRTGKIILR